jgi:hypothetical protein
MKAQRAMGGKLFEIGGGIADAQGHQSSPEHVAPQHIG